MRRFLIIGVAVGTSLLAVLQATGVSLAPRSPTVRELAQRRLATLHSETETGPLGRGTPPFTDVAPVLGIDFVHDAAARGNYFLPEGMGPGAGFLDYDGDGDLDVFVAGGGAIVDDGPIQTSRLYRNDGEWFTDVTDAAGAAVPGPAFGVAAADYDNDRDVDIFISRAGPNALLRNEGNGTFREVAAQAGVDGKGFGASVTWFDADLDGWLDLYVANYVEWSPQTEVPCYSVLGERDYCNPITYPAASDEFYRNLGDGHFENATRDSGIGAERGNGLGVLATDFDGNGWLDLYVANDQTPAFLWRNRGGGRFENTALISGSAYNAAGVAIAGMGVACEDLDRDSDCDLLVTNIHDQTHLVLRNDAGSFEDISLAVGVGTFSMPATTFGVALFDQDLDGELDGFFCNGEVNVVNRMPAGDNPYAQPDHFVRWVDGRFVDASAESGVQFGDVGRGVATGDYDGDGDLDLLVSNNRGPLRLLRNNDRSGRAWLMVDVRTADGTRSALGARVHVTAGGRSWVREVRRQQSYLSSQDPRAHFGLGHVDRVERLEIRWPDGFRVEREDVAINQVLVVEPGAVR